MAVLDPAIIDELAIEFQVDASTIWELIASLTKTEVRAAVEAADQWVEDNKVSYNNALPLAARTNLTAAQKSRILTYVVKRRYQEGE